MTASQVGSQAEVRENLSGRSKARLGFKVWWGYGRTSDLSVEVIDPNDEFMSETCQA